jgi:hypothetical protein
LLILSVKKIFSTYSEICIDFIFRNITMFTI